MTSTYHPVKQESNLDLQIKSTTNPLGEPIEKKRISLSDIGIVLSSVLCFLIAVITIHPDVGVAAYLQATKQLIVIGLLLSLMNLCWSSILSYLFISFEAQRRHATLQNLDGLLKLSPTANQLSLSWRIVLLLSYILPLSLSISYKYFVGGTALTKSQASAVTFAPHAPPGFQNQQRAYNSIFENLISPFTAASNDADEVPTTLPQAYGSSIILLSNVSAAAVDGPPPEEIISIQKSLQDDTSIILRASVRGSVVHYNPETGTPEYWNQKYDMSELNNRPLYNNFSYVTVRSSKKAPNPVESWDRSWTLATSMHQSLLAGNDTTRTNNFIKYAKRFEVKRHNCQVNWRITNNTINIVDGDCDDVLGTEHQYYEKSQLGFTTYLGQNMADHLGPFGSTRNNSDWMIPAYVSSIAAAYQSIVAAKGAKIDVPAGDLSDTDDTREHHESYTSTTHMSREVPILKPHWALYIVLGIQPCLTMAALFGTIYLSYSPVARDFGLVSVLAGVSVDTLHLINGAALSGRLRKPVSVGIGSSDNRGDSETDVSRDPGHGKVEYRLGETGPLGRIQQGITYY